MPRMELDLGPLRRIWARDHRVGKPEPTEISDRLGWLDITARMAPSSLAPEVLGGL